MMDDYMDRFYNKLAVRGTEMKENNFAKAKQISAWKEKVAAMWDEIEVKSLNIPDELLKSPVAGQEYKITAQIDTKDQSETNFGLELVFTYQDEKNITRIYTVKEFEVINKQGSLIDFALSCHLNNGGSYKYGIRLFPKNSELPNRQNFCYVRWI
jgi:starch phosphorylase